MEVLGLKFCLLWKRRRVRLHRLQPLLLPVLLLVRQLRQLQLVRQLRLLQRQLRPPQRVQVRLRQHRQVRLRLRVLRQLFKEDYGNMYSMR